MIKHISIINDCLDANARLRIESQVKKEFPGVPFTFYGVSVFSTLALSFLLAEGDFGEGDLLLFNAAPRSDSAQHKDNRSGELVFAKLKNGAWAVGPNEGFSLTLIKDQITELHTDPKDRANKEGTQFRSAYVFPRLASTFLASPGEFEQERLEEWVFVEPSSTKVVWIDSFGNIKLSSKNHLDKGRPYTVRLSRGGETYAKVEVPYRGNLTNVRTKELALITGSSFGQTGLELIYREALPGQKTTTRFLKEQFNVEVYPEDDVTITAS